MKRLSMVLASLFAVIALNAQHPHWGIKGGINVANIEVENGSDPGSRVGIHLGGLAHIHLSEHFALQPELMYSNQGAKREIRQY